MLSSNIDAIRAQVEMERAKGRGITPEMMAHLSLILAGWSLQARALEQVPVPPGARIAATMALRWTEPTGDVVARPIATIDHGRRLVLRDGADRYHLAGVGPDGRISILTGPVSVEDALDLALLVLRGVGDHHSVSGMINQLALALVATAALVRDGAP